MTITSFLTVFLFLAINPLSHLVKANDDDLGNLILKLYNQFKPAMALTNSTTLNQWMAALPTDREMDEMSRLIKHIYPLDNYDQLNNSLLTTKFPNLAKVVQLTILERDFCVIHEPLKKTQSYKFPRFFGFVILRAERAVTKRLHHSASHFDSDGRVCRQASALFYWSGAKSLVIAGASRWAVKGKHNSPCQPKNAIADASHNTNLIFHIANTAMLESAKDQAKEKRLEDIFIQWHGMAETSCVKSPVFISTGASGKSKIYESKSLYANKLKNEVNNLMKMENYAHTPKSDSACNLAATNNVFGRLINGVHYGFECDVSAVAENIKGNFVHIEQKRSARENLTLWREALKRVPLGSGEPNFEDNNHSMDCQTISSIANILLLGFSLIFV